MFGDQVFIQKKTKTFFRFYIVTCEYIHEYIYFLDLSGYIILGDVYMIKQHTAGHLPTENFKALGSL